MSEAAAQIWKDRYEIERPLGRGGMSAVFLAKDRQLLSKRVVIKVLLEEMNEDAWVRQKFFQEMEALARIDHPGVVGVLDTGQTPDGKQFLVMQYIEGQTLRSAIEPGGMPLARAASLIRQVGQALAAAHEAGVWHRDLKPENVMLQRSGGDDYAKLIDFGIAGIQNSQFTGEKTKVAGSLTYMAPEQFAGKPCAGSDIYALGVLAYEMLTGDPPFTSSSMAHLVTDDQTMTLPRMTRPDIPEAAERSIMKALSFRPEARQVTVRQFSEDLYAALSATGPVLRTVIDTPPLAPAVAGKGQRTTNVETAPNAVAPAPSKSKAPLIAIAAVAVLGVAGAGWFVLRPKPEPPAPAASIAPAASAEQLKLLFQMEYKGDTKVAFKVETPQEGYLYILNYGQDKGNWTFNMLFPLHSGTAKRAAGEYLRIPPGSGWFEANSASDTNIPYLVFSPQTIKEMEDLKKLKQVEGVAIVDDPALVAPLQQFLKSHHSESSQNAGQTELRTGDKVLVHEISLDRK